MKTASSATFLKTCKAERCQNSEEKPILSLPLISHIPFTDMHDISKHNALFKRVTVVRDAKNY